ncbi:MAG: isoleucine--tRNA ligase, partial [Proteobacteria bacterium]|nr:isoleucine--tRNA ligase [Pseudomonadota bacterium]
MAHVEQEFLGFWKDSGLYQKMLEKNKDKKRYILHDGPPYANGHIHLGHAINRILKDIVVKYKAMTGNFAPFIPGWDCHGLPIETQLLKEVRGQGLGVRNILEFRKGCREYAMKFVGIQRDESIQLGVFGDWFNPYLTLDPTYEEKVLEVFGKLADKGYVYRGLKPIHWCPHCETALAEAEIEYHDERSPSIFVKFKATDVKPLKKLDKHSPLHKITEKGDDAHRRLYNIYFIIWTTTPWTLPANVAIAAHPKYEYVFLNVGEEIWVVSEGLLNILVEKLRLKEHKIIDKTRGEFLEGIVCKHPFLDRDSRLVLDEYVTLEQGTGLVHIAPGHGIEDYQVGLKYKLPIVMPVDSKGYFDNTVGEFSGKYYDESNKLITQRMEKDGSLLKLEFIKHSYPHCWRCKKPVIFRATEQWFISVDHDKMREHALKAIGKTKWIPAWGENRIRGMVETRPDWCISRQRSWGVPIPAFYCKACGKVHYKGKFNEAARELVKNEGTDGWFAREPKDFLPKGLKCECGASDFTKETDILDVWFESGSSHAAVLETRKELRWPADLYLEGSDQHRGWFQSSLLTSIGYKGRAPFDAVLTHGFTVDDKGKKMSKSLG